MAKKRSKPAGTAKPGRKPAPKASPGGARGGTVTSERSARLHKMLKLLGSGAKTRATLTRQLGLDVRGFYRDLELLRAANIAVSLGERGYVLEEALDEAVLRLPFPDPHLTLGEAQALAKGRSAAHKKLKQQLDQIMK